MIFQNRSEAGRKLAEKLEHYHGQDNVVVMGLARGGVVVAHEIASTLELPFDVVVVRKVGAPDNEELALGAVTDQGKGIFNDELITLLGVSKEYLRKEAEKQKELVKQRKELYLKGRKAMDPANKTVILVDDGIATGASMRVAIDAVKAQNAAKIVLAVPVASAESLAEISKIVDEVVCLSAPRTFHAVGAFYKEFSQVSDAEVEALMNF
ncbi:MAG: putative phosphoribosyl transferase [Chlamydiae bacterium]|nr:putative phosphoribosyl transferase [Chlamydiota bacterium]